MDEARALAIVSALANGVNPLTGELFAAESAYQSPDVIRALYCAQRALEAAGRRRVRAQSAATSNVGKPWSEDEDRQLLSAFDGGRPLAELAQAHGRTRGGIQARLIRHGRLAPEGDRPIGGPGKWRQAAAVRSRVEGGGGA
ncbi:MAG TPA: hypothetical protein VJQ52_05220 [Steroidobacteraceae bacterium]|nr:hypothetical protein [Steroidobacteraceae bacterium]